MVENKKKAEEEKIKVVFFFFLRAVSRNDSTINSSRRAATLRDDTPKTLPLPTNTSELWKGFYPPNTKKQTHRDG